jgi:hypothetical protein
MKAHYPPAQTVAADGECLFIRTVQQDELELAGDDVRTRWAPAGYSRRALQAFLTSCATGIPHVMRYRHS